MAYVREEWCEKCQRKTMHINNDGCGICYEKKKAEQERIWEAQDPETKMTNLRKRIEELERDPRRYF